MSSISTSGTWSGSSAASFNQKFDPNGNLLSKTPTGVGGAADTLTWDSFGRLVKVSRRGGTNDFDWRAVYDGLGRRLLTKENAVGSREVVTTASSYDPEVEFLEISVTKGTVTNWKIHGPDLNGVYGGLQGIGGLECVYAAGLSTGVISDNYGHVVANNTGDTSVAWSTAKRVV
jgi:hypothetical protein